jgi:uncharacterized coiled-coil protein SlyX
MPTFVRQLDGSPNAGDNCGPASVAMALRWATAHEIEPSPSQVRKAMKDPTGGTYMADHRLAWDEYRERNAHRWDLKPMRYFAAGEFADLITALGSGKGATIAIDYSKVPLNMKGDPAFMGLHSVFLAAVRERAGQTEVKVFDPLNDGRRPGIPGPGPVWYPKVMLRNAASAVVSQPGRAMYNLVERGTRLEVDVPDTCEEKIATLEARVGLLEETLGSIRGMLVASQMGIAQALADIDEVLAIPEDTGQAANEGVK